MIGNHGKYTFIDEELERRRRMGRLRALRNVNPLGRALVEIDGRKLVNFCSNDYLGLSQHPLLAQRAVAFMETYGAGSTASRLVCGNLEAFQMVEEELARLKGTETALLFPSGYQANVTLLPAIADRRSLILSDRLNHNSIINGGRLARCRVRVFEHNDLDHLENLLKAHPRGDYSRTIIVTESVFSMDGDRSDVPALSRLAEQYQALLVVDEAHATGVLGENGMGLAGHGLADLVMGTFSKAAGCFGAYLACTRPMKDYLVNCCTGLIYSTALPPAVLGAMHAALELIPGMTKERKHLAEMGQILRTSLKKMGYDTGDSTTQIIPIVVGSERDTLAFSQILEENGIMATAIRPPTVPEGQSRIRVALSAQHTMAQIEQLEKVAEARSHGV